MALYTAFAIAAATPVIPISPIPFTPMGFTYGSTSSTKVTSIVPMSACTGTWYSARSAFMYRPVRASTRVSSSSAIPTPQTMPPWSWLRPVLALRILPAP